MREGRKKEMEKNLGRKRKGGRNGRKERVKDMKVCGKGER